MSINLFEDETVGPILDKCIETALNDIYTFINVGMAVDGWDSIGIISDLIDVKAKSIRMRIYGKANYSLPSMNADGSSHTEEVEEYVLRYIVNRMRAYWSLELSRRPDCMWLGKEKE
jgi:hypothetical protein